MKKSLALPIIIFSIILSSCATKKDSAFDGSTQIQNPPAITKALEKPSVRAYGVATQFDLGFATRTAAATARQELAANLMQIISSNNQLNNYSYQLFATDKQNSGSVKDEEQKIQEIVEAIIPEIPVNGAVIIENNIYKTKDGQYQVFVCIEYQGESMELANKMADGYRKYLEQRVSEEKRKEIDKRVDEFREYSQKRIREVTGN